MSGGIFGGNFQGGMSKGICPGIMLVSQLVMFNVTKCLYTRLAV